MLKTSRFVLAGLLLAVFTQLVFAQNDLIPVNTINWGSDGSEIITGHYGKLAFWNASTSQLIRTVDVFDPLYPDLPLLVLSLDLNSDGSKIAVGTSQREPIGLILIQDAGTEQILNVLESQNGVSDVEWSPNGNFLAAAAPELFGTFGEDAVIIWDSTTGVEQRRISGGMIEGVSSISWHPNGNWIATAGAVDNVARVWDANTGALISTLSGHEDLVSVVSWSPTGDYIATGSQDSTVKVWNSATSQLLSTFVSSDGSVRDLAWSPDGTELAIAGTMTGQVIEPQSGELLATFAGQEIVSWNPTGTTLAFGQDDKVAIYDDSGSLLSTLIPPLVDTPTPGVTFTSTTVPSATPTPTATDTA